MVYKHKNTNKEQWQDQFQQNQRIQIISSPFLLQSNSIQLRFKSLQKQPQLNPKQIIQDKPTVLGKQEKKLQEKEKIQPSVISVKNHEENQLVTVKKKLQVLVNRKEKTQESNKQINNGAEIVFDECFELPPYIRNFHKVTKQLEVYIKKLTYHDFSILFQDKGVIKLLKFIACTIKKIPYKLSRQPVQHFLDLFDSRIKRYRFYEVIYKQLSEICQQLQKFYQYKGDRTKVKDKYYQSHYIYYKLIEEAESRYRSGQCYKRYVYKYPVFLLNQHIKKVPSFYKSQKWRKIIQKVRYQIQRKIFSPPIIVIGTMIDERQELLRKRQHNQKIIDKFAYPRSCLGCIQYFIENWNIYDQTVHQVTLALIGQIKDIIKSKTNEQKRQEIIKKIKQQVCALLNSGGGVILFDCDSIYHSVIPVGQILTDQEVFQIQSVIKKELLSKINPKLNYGSDIRVSFVRMLRDPFYEDSQYNTNDIPDKMFIPDLFTVMITVRPGKNQTYLYQDKYQLYKAYRHKSIYHDQIKCTKVQKQSEMKYLSTCQREKSNWAASILDRPYSNLDHEKCKSLKHNLTAQDISTLCNQSNEFYLQLQAKSLESNQNDDSSIKQGFICRPDQYDQFTELQYQLYEHQLYSSNIQLN